MEIVHGETCDCCEKLTPNTKKALAEIASFMGPGNVAGDKKKILRQLKQINAKLAPAGGINDIVALTEEFFKIDFNSLSLADLEPKPVLKKLSKTATLKEIRRNKPTLVEIEKARKTALEKSVGKFKIKDITDNPNLDPNKAMNLAKLDLSKLNNLKISFSVPTITVVKSLKFGPVSLDIKFMISLKEIYWAPTMEADYSSLAKALKTLKGATTTSLVKPSSGKSLQDLKKIAQESQADNITVLNDLLSATSAESFFSKLNAQQINLYETKKLDEEFKKILDEKDATKKIIKKVITDEVGLKIIENKNDLNSIEHCEPRKPEFTKFTEDELVDAVPCAVIKKSIRPLEVKAAAAIEEIKKSLKDMPTAKDAEDQKKALDDFINDVNAANAIMQDCSAKKQKALSRQYFFKEAEILHRYTHEYVLKRFQSNASYNPSYIAIFKERDRLITEAANIAASITTVEDQIRNAASIVEAAAEDGTSLVPNQLPTDVTVIAGGTLLNLTSNVSTVTDTINPLQQQLGTLIDSYNTDVIAIQAQNTLFNQSIAELNAGIQADLASSFITPVSSLFSDQIAAIRGRLNIELNPISNLQGFETVGSFGTFRLYVNNAIFAEAKTIENAAKGQAPSFINPSINGTVVFAGGTQIIENYFTNLNFDFTVILNADSSVAQPKIRAGLIELAVWKKFYSPFRVDELFTWQEQGYTAPKPTYDSLGKAVGATESVEIVNGLGEKMIQVVPTSVKNCQVDLAVAVPFLENIEVNTKNKVESLILEINNGGTSKNYIDKIRYFAELEARTYFYNFISNVSFNNDVNIYDLSVPQEFERSYTISSKIYSGLQDKIKSVQMEIDGFSDCVANQQSNIEELAKTYAKKSGQGDAGGSDSDNIKQKCKDKLGSDPVGNKVSTGECPTFVKNCYWKEYTKMLQIVSLMPIPELSPLDLKNRLFRYYPVALQIPVPVPPGVLPSLAMGIPDPLLSIPLPFLWKHIITLNTPFGLFVVWIALAGGVIPNPFVMFVDEQNQAMFLVTPKGLPTNLPASQLNMQPLEFDSLLDFIKFKKPLKIDLSTPLGKLLTGSTRGNPLDPDDPSTIIDKIKSKIQKSLDDLEITDPPSFSGRSDRAIKSQRDIKKALEYIPPDAVVIEKTLTEVLGLAEAAVDKIKISSIHIPKNSKGMMMEMPPVVELLETMSGLVDSALSSPADVAEIILGEIGAAIKTLDVKEKLNQIARTQVDKPGIKKLFVDYNVKISEMEATLEASPVGPEAEAKRKEYILKRTKMAKKMAVVVLKKVADSITPEMLGFIETLTLPITSPVPCYTSIPIPALPPWVTMAIGLIKQAPSIINAFPDEQLAELLAGVLNLSKPLPNAEALFYSIINKILGLIPDLVIPVGINANLLKQIAESLKNWLLTFKMRLPKPGLPTQLVIPGSLIKSLIKQAISLFLSALKALIMQKVNEAINAVGVDKVTKIYAILAIIKLIFGVALHQIKGADIKAFIKSLLESVAFPPLDQVKALIQTATALVGKFKSIKELLELKPDPIQIAKKLLEGEGPFFEIGAEQLKAFVDPILTSVVPALSNALPFPAILLGCSFPVTRLALTKINPVKVSDKLPNWEGITLKNIPYVVWLDQLAASAQRYSLLASNYTPAPYFTPPT